MAMRRFAVLLSLVVCAAVGTSPAPRAQARCPMTLVDLMNIPRVGDPQMTRDGQRITFVMATTD